METSRHQVSQLGQQLQLVWRDVGDCLTDAGVQVSAAPAATAPEASLLEFGQHLAAQVRAASAELLHLRAKVADVAAMETAFQTTLQQVGTADTTITVTRSARSARPQPEPFHAVPSLHAETNQPIVVFQAVFASEMSRVHHTLLIMDTHFFCYTNLTLPPFKRGGGIFLFLFEVYAKPPTSVPNERSRFYGTN